MRKNYLFVFLLLTLKLASQNQEIDPTFNKKETGTYQQDIGSQGIVLSNKKILTVFEHSYDYNVLLLNEDGSLDKNFNTTDSYTRTSIKLYAKSDGQFLTLDYNGKLKGFNANGTANSNFITTTFGILSTTMTMSIKNVVYQEDGKVIVYGSFQTVNGEYTGGCVRLNADGSIDNTFKSDYTPNAMAIQSDGKYIFALRGASGLIRLLPNGKIDNTFKVVATIDPKLNFVTNGFETENNSSIQDVTVQPDGKIIAVGCNYKENGKTISYSIVRLNNDGTRDKEFKSLDSRTLRADNVYLQKDNKIVLDLNHETFIRLESNGETDNTFKYINTVGFLNKGEFSFQGNKMIISAHFKDLQGITRSGIHRINENGSLDLTFNPHSGFNLFFDQWDDFNTYPFVSKVLADQKILCVGNFTTYNDFPVRNICRLQQNGDLDSNFNLDPAITIDADITNKYIFIQQKDGKVILLHEDGLKVNNTWKSIIRLNSDGSLDSSFNSPIEGGSIVGMKQISDGKILLIGSSKIFKNTTEKYSSYNLIRLNTDGSIDSSFKAVFYHKPYILHSLSNDNFLVSFAQDNYAYTYSAILKINKDGVVDTSFKPSSQGYYKTKELNNGQLLVTVSNVLSRVNANGTVDPTFTPYNFGTSNVYYYDFYENGAINILAVTENNTNKKITLSSEGKLLSTETFSINSISNFEIQNCEDVISYGYFTKVNNQNNHGIVRFKFSNTNTSVNPEGEIFQPFTNGQTLADLKINGTDIKWYSTQSNCGINNKLTNKGMSEEVLPSSTVLVNGTTYFASQTVNNVESGYRLPVTVYSSTLGLKENQLPNLITYPNPVKDFYSVSNTENITKIEIYNILGQLLSNKNYDKNKIEIDFTTLQSGLYFTKIYAGDKSSIIKVIKN
ncbi:hypothetical protein HYN56_17540 [Flavobacterium crocinum]|uniref:Secretion system C-terminal sorting domain-containing protein n=1 Tax=Flavobacterium crocinum TaxID=2183896 RepID=A0A2S1YP96_9FLAO|nr:T9SS type A sorting domain-containing protein [Flavobacterium crocinum]AWK05930.1 hypothetical protein HYN56_17540 [Flavobacterium crocinum]